MLRYREDGQRRKFLFEPLYAYKFSPGVVKMTCLDPSQLGPLNGAGLPRPLLLGDFAYTERDFGHGPFQTAARYRDPVRGQRALVPLLSYPHQTPAGQGRLELRCLLPPARQPDRLPAPLYTLLTRPDRPKFRRLQPGLGVLHALPPGRYRAAVLLADSSCLAPRELILVEANGQTYYQLRPADYQPAGALSHRLNQLVWRLAQPLAGGQAAPAERREIRVEQPGQPQPSWLPLRGRVFDQTSEEGLPGTTVLVQGTTVGTSTAADGSFTLRVPPGAQMLVFSSVGFVTQERAIDYNRPFEVSLTADVRQLSEVVEVGYGSQRRADLTGSVSTLLQGRAAGVLIRGNSSVAISSQPLYIVSGLPFNGTLSNIAPADILAVKVLKDTEAMAIYGSRASSGVVLLTLKNGATVGGRPVGPATSCPARMRAWRCAATLVLVTRPGGALPSSPTRKAAPTPA